MNVHAQPAEPAFAALLHRQERKSLLRFIACGSVDHGKSTLIGRLLYDSKQVFDDQLDALDADSRKFGTARRRARFLAAVRRTGGRARAEDHDRRRLSFLLDGAPQVHRHRCARARGIYRQYGDRRFRRRSRARPGRRRGRPDPPDQAPPRDPVDARRPPCRARRQQDGSRRLVARRVRRCRNSIPRIGGRPRFRRHRLHSGRGKKRR